MADQYRPAPVSETWSASEWERRRAHAAAFLATGEKWVVGPAVVRFYERGRDAALARERAD